MGWTGIGFRNLCSWWSKKTDCSNVKAEPWRTEKGDMGIKFKRRYSWLRGQWIKCSVREGVACFIWKGLVSHSGPRGAMRLENSVISYPKHLVLMLFLWKLSPLTLKLRCFLLCCQPLSLAQCISSRNICLYLFPIWFPPVLSSTERPLSWLLLS